MVYYVTARDKGTAKRVVDELQKQNFTDCYISPLTAISCLGDLDILPERKTALRLDLLTVCDALIVCTPVSDDIYPEINLAKRVKMEVVYYDPT